MGGAVDLAPPLYKSLDPLLLITSLDKHWYTRYSIQRY